MKIKSKLILNTILASNLCISIININNVNAYTSLINEENSTDIWETRANMNEGRVYFSSAVLNEKIYAIGGYDYQDEISNTVEIYDPTTNTWTPKKPLNTDREGMATAVVDNKLYLIGGDDGYETLNTIEVYDETTDSWEMKTPMNSKRYSPATAVVDGKIYVIGGHDSGRRLDTVEMYDPETDTWTNKASISEKKDGMTSAVIDGKIYIMGGYWGNSFKTVEMYDPVADKWEIKSPMNLGRSYFISAVINNKIYVIGGYDEDYNPLNTVEVYDPTTDTWESKSGISIKRDGASGVAIGDTIYIMGGYDEDMNVLSSVEAYMPNKNILTNNTEELVQKAEETKEPSDIENARNEVNKLPEGQDKQGLQDRLDVITPNITLTSNSATANVDIYIKSENMLLMNLSTNQITFDDYSGVDEIEKPNALNISINSSLPYQLNAYLVDEIKNSDGSNKIDIDRLQIKDNNEDSYSEFTAINNKLALKDNCESGNDKQHNIDIKFKGGNAYKADIYKTVIKFEAEQK